MSSKISVSHIMVRHYGTLFINSTRLVKAADFFIFFGLPLIVSGISNYAGLVADNDLVSLCVNFGSIFTALLLSVLVLVYDQENKIIDKARQVNSTSSESGSSSASCINGGDVNRLRAPKDSAKRVLMKELYANISYCIVVSVLLVTASAINLGLITIEKGATTHSLILHEINTNIFTPFLVFLSMHLLITIVMVVKRLYALLLSNDD